MFRIVVDGGRGGGALNVEVKRFSSSADVVILLSFLDYLPISLISKTTIFE